MQKNKDIEMEVVIRIRLSQDEYDLLNEVSEIKTVDILELAKDLIVSNLKNKID